MSATNPAMANYHAAKEKYQLKQKAIEYYKENGVPQKMEEILNSMFYDQPDDVYGHLASYFEQFIKPAAIAKVTARQMLDGRGQPTIQTQVYCAVSNTEKLLSTCISASPNSHLLDNARMEERETEEQRKAESVKVAISYINKEISSKVKGMKPFQQREVDAIVSLYMQILKEAEDARRQSEEGEEPPQEEIKQAPAPVSPTKEGKKDKEKDKGKSSPKAASKHKTVSATNIIPDEAREIYVQGAELVSAVSQAMCVAGAQALNVPVYQHIANIFRGEEWSELRMPLPMVTIMQSGKAAGGKQNCIKEFMVIPSPGFSYTQSLDYVTGIYSYVEKALIGKSGDAPVERKKGKDGKDIPEPEKKKGKEGKEEGTPPSQRNVNESGALCPTFDRPEQGLDLLIEAITAANLTPGEDIHIAINAAAHEMFEFEKGKYEVMTGSLKSSDELVDFWVELMSRYQGIMLIIDPLRKQDHDSWMRLNDRVTEHCFVASSKMYPRPGLLNIMDMPEQVMTGAAVLSLENLTSVTDLCTSIKKLEGIHNHIILEARAGETCDDFLADLAVAMNIRFFKLGAPNRGERVSKYNRLLQIEMELELNGKLALQIDHEFTHMAMPADEEGEATGPAPASPPPPAQKEKEGKKEGKKK